MVAIDRRTRRGARLLARIAARSARLAAALRRDLHRQQWPRARSSRSRRIHGPPSGWEQPAAGGGAVWVHYGANIGAAGGDLSILSTSDDLCALAAAELIRAGRPADRIAPKTLVPSGETRDIHRAGGRYLTLVGSNPLFHLPQDRWPHAVDAAAVARIADAAACLVVKLTR